MKGGVREGGAEGREVTVFFHPFTPSNVECESEKKDPAGPALTLGRRKPLAVARVPDRSFRHVSTGGTGRVRRGRAGRARAR